MELAKCVEQARDPSSVVVCGEGDVVVCGEGGEGDGGSLGNQDSRDSKGGGASNLHTITMIWPHHGVL